MKVFDKAIESRLDRRCTFVALGGGVIGDLCGYAAASFLRGVNFIQIPTTVMSQVSRHSELLNSLSSTWLFIPFLLCCRPDGSSLFYFCPRWILLLGGRQA